MPSPFRYHSLATSTYSLSATGISGGRTTIAPYIPLAMCARTGFVPQWYMKTPGSFALKRKVNDSPGLTSVNALFGSDPGGVEVHRVRDRAAVHERELDRLALADVDDRPGRAGGAVEGPDVVLHPGRDLDGAVLHHHLDLDDVDVLQRRHPGVVGGVCLRELFGVLGRHAGEALERERRVVRGRVVLRCRRRRLGRLVRPRGRSRVEREDERPESGDRSCGDDHDE